MNALWRPAAGMAAAATVLLACGGEAPGDANPDYLLMNPERLAELRVQCRLDPTALREAVCRAVAEATRRRFMGEGTPYVPAPAPAQRPASGPSAPGATR